MDGGRAVNMRRFFPDGTEGGPLIGITISKCRMYASMGLHYNLGMSKQEAQRWAAQIKGPGTYEYEGYRFEVWK